VLETAKRLFDKEAEILYSLGSHDRIPRLLAHFQEGEQFYLVQEFADGLDLTQEIGKGKSLSQTAAIALLKEILEILVFVHGRGVVHRDIKPANLIRRSSDRKIVLIDFGAVKEIGGMAADLQGNTNLTIAIGSPGYMPIEQMNGKPRLSSDIYAVGMMVIQSITGAEARSFTEHPDTAELIWRDRLQGSYSSGFLDILDKMIRYDFRQRYQTAQEVLDAIVATMDTFNVFQHDRSTIISPINEQSEFLDIIDKMLSPDSQQRYQTAQEVSEAISTMTNIPNTSHHDLPTVITARITADNAQGVPATTINSPNSPNSPHQITASQNLPARSDLLTPLPSNTNPSRFKQDLKEDALNQNLKCFPWKKVLIIGGIIAAISTIVTISKLSKTNPMDEVINNSVPISNPPTPPIAVPPIPIPPIAVPPIPNSSIAPISKPIAPSPNPVRKSAEELIAQSVLLNRNDKSQEALAKIEEALKLDSKNADAWAAKGFTLAKLERDSEAIVAFEKAIELRPEFPFARQNKLQLVRKARTKR
jgi:serine/threonine protein kinase